MAFQQRKLDRSVNQSRGIFDKYIYRPDNGDTSADVQVPGYFSEARFASDWANSILEIRTSDAYLIGQVDENSNLFIFYDSSTSGGSGVETFNGRSGDVLPVINDYDPFFLRDFNRVVVINSEADFPVQDGSTITLEDNFYYLIGDVVNTAKQFICGSCTFRSFGTSVVPIVDYTGTAPMFDVTESQFLITDITIRCTNSYVFDIKGSGSGSVNERVNAEDMIISACTGVALMSDGSSFLVRNTEFSSATGPSLVTIGPGAGALLSFRQMGFFNIQPGAVAIDFDVSATFQVAEFTDVLAFGDSSAIFMSGATGSGNVPVGSLFTVEGCNSSQFNTSLVGITVNDDGWLFQQNDGIPDSVINGHAYLPTLTTVTIPGGGTGDFFKIAGGGWLTSRSDRVSISADGDITNTSSRSINVLVTGSVTVDTGGIFFSNGVALRIVKNSDPTETQSIASEAFVDSFNETDAYVAGSFVLDPGDSVAIWVANLDDETAIPIPRAKLIIFGRV